MKIRLSLAFLTLGLMSARASADGTDDRRALMVAGQVVRSEGRLLRARDLFSTCVRAPCPESAANDCADIGRYCKSRLDEVEHDIPVVTVHVEDDRGVPIHDATIRVDADGVDGWTAMRLDPGHHVARASYARRTGTIDFDIVPTQQSTIRVVIDLRQTIALRPVPSYAIALGSTALAFAVGAIAFGIASQVQVDDMAFCRPTCGHERQGLFATTTTLVDVALLATAVSTLATAVAVLARPTVHKTVHIEETVSRGSQ